MSWARAGADPAGADDHRGAANSHTAPHGALRGGWPFGHRQPARWGNVLATQWRPSSPAPGPLEVAGVTGKPGPESPQGPESWPSSTRSGWGEAPGTSSEYTGEAIRGPTPSMEGRNERVMQHEHRGRGPGRVIGSGRHHVRLVGGAGEMSRRDRRGPRRVEGWRLASHGRGGPLRPARGAGRPSRIAPMITMGDESRHGPFPVDRPPSRTPNGRRPRPGPGACSYMGNFHPGPAPPGAADRRGLRGELHQRPAGRPEGRPPRSGGAPGVAPPHPVLVVPGVAAGERGRRRRRGWADIFPGRPAPSGGERAAAPCQSP